MESHPKKICYIIPSVKSGGIENYLLRFLNHHKTDSSNTVLVRNESKGELYSSYLASGAKLVFKPLGNLNLSNLYWYYKFFKQQKFDVVCDFNANFAGPVMFLAWMAKISTRITFYRQSTHLFNNPTFVKIAISKILNQLVFKFSTQILSNSKAGLRFFFENRFEQCPERFSVVRNGIEIDKYQNIFASKNELREQLHLPVGKYIIGHVGRLTPAKNHRFIFEVAKELIQEFPELYFVFIGKNTGDLKLIIDELGLPGKHFYFMDHTNDIHIYLKAFDLFFFPSVSEGQPNALIEAMVSGLPVITSNIESIKECIPTTHHFLCLDPKDIEHAIQLIKDAMNTPQLFQLQEFAATQFAAAQQFQNFKSYLK